MEKVESKGSDRLKYPGRIGRWLYKIPILWYRLGLGCLFANFLLLLTTTGRRTGLSRDTPIEYEELDGVFYIISAWGTRPDWYRNILADPGVRFQLGRRRFSRLAVPVSDPEVKAAVIGRKWSRGRIYRHLLQLVGVPPNASSEEIRRVASKLTMVAIRPGT
ncbi:MAG: nitroreductase/quinone reductase family protein [Candidatus Bathyarchaeia archaeon]